MLDYGVGNLGSVIRALEELRVKPLLVDRAADMSFADSLILPGVGNFRDCMRILDQNGWTSALKQEVLGCNKPLLGICLGMQLLAEKGLEGTADGVGTPGLGLIPGEVVSLRSIGCRQRVPHVGWNAIEVIKSEGVLLDIPNGTDFYFVHSYAFVPQNQYDVLAFTNYSVPVAAVVGRNHVWGTQFHPEKSSRAGFKVLRNFVKYSSC